MLSSMIFEKIVNKINLTKSKVIFMAHHRHKNLVRGLEPLSKCLEKVFKRKKKEEISKRGRDRAKKSLEFPDFAQHPVKL